MERSIETSPWPRRGLIALLLAIHAGLCLWGMLRNSVTVDEVNHLPAGLTYLEQLTFGLYHHNPPLVKMLAGIPVLAGGARVDYDHEWQRAARAKVQVHPGAFGYDFMQANREPPGHYDALFLRARLVILMFSLAGGLIVYRWAQELYGDGPDDPTGPRAGLIALSLWTFSPNLLAHAGLMTTDLPSAVVGMGATYLFWRWLKHPLPTPAVWVGVALGVAQLTKFSSLILFGIWPVLALGSLVANLRTQPFKTEEELDNDDDEGRLPNSVLGRLLHLAGCGMVILAICTLTINVGYLLEGTGKPLGDYEFLSTSLTVPRTSGQGAYPNSPLGPIYQSRVNRFRDSLLGGIPVPLPEHYLLGFDEQLFEAKPGMPGGGYPMYLRGELRRTGWWYYYFYAIGVKTPLGSLALLAAATVGTLLLPRLRIAWVDELFVWFPPITMLLAMSFLTDINIGVRYALPCFPFGILIAARVARAWTLPAWRRFTIGALLLQAAATLWIAPHYLAYFNLLVGGPSHGHEHLIDSNLDWGQDVLALKAELDRRGHQGPLPAAIFGNLDLSLEGIDASLIPRDPRTFNPQWRHVDEPAQLTPGLYAVSANYVMGYPYRWVYKGRVFDSPENAYAYFQSLTPVAKAGYSIWLYELSAEDCARLNRELGLPAS